MADAKADILIGIDAGTSVIKAVAFDLQGQQIAVAAIPNRYQTQSDGAVTQSQEQTWLDCAQALRDLGKKIAGLAQRTVAIGVTAQGDGTWLVGKANQPIGDAWLWLDARAAPTVSRLRGTMAERARFEATGTGLSACQQGTQLAHILATQPDLLAQAEVALHCKDWLYLNLTDIRASDPSEVSFTYGNFRTRDYDALVIDSLGLHHQTHLLPDIIDGSQLTHPLSDSAALATGLLAGTPVSLGFVDMACTALGAGVYTGEVSSACSVIGSTGVHLRAVSATDVYLNAAGTGYVIPLPIPIPNIVTQVQSNMAAALNIDWILQLAADLVAEFDERPSHAQLVARIDGWLAASRAGAILYHPYISDAGERGPFVNAKARASLMGLTSTQRFPDILRAVIEGLAMATRDCYQAMGSLPETLILTGGAARSRHLRSIFAASVNANIATSSREEAGAAGAAMMASVAMGIYPDMKACIAQWVTPLITTAEAPDPVLVDCYQTLFSAYVTARQGMEPVWEQLAPPHYS